jgi:hypothetical protein
LIGFERWAQLDVKYRIHSVRFWMLLKMIPAVLKSAEESLWLTVPSSCILVARGVAAVRFDWRSRLETTSRIPSLSAIRDRWTMSALSAIVTAAAVIVVVPEWKRTYSNAARAGLLSCEVKIGRIDG